MADKRLIVRLAATLCLIWVEGSTAATIEGVRLIGDSTSDYIIVQSSTSYTLRCVIRAGYDDPLEAVNWHKDGRLVYSWTYGDSISTAYSDLVGQVVTAGFEDLKDIRFNKLVSFGVSGNYTCEVISEKGRTKSDPPYPLVVLDIPSDDFQSHVSLMSDTSDDQPTENENVNCTLLWDFKTPAIFPRPNVTCGYYSYLHDDVTKSIPAGLTMHMLKNGSWMAKFDHIHMQVSEIPRERRLGCSVSVPFTSYKKVVKFEDNFAIDHLIDSEGCPSMFLDPFYRLKISIEEGQMNCRGDLMPSSSDRPLLIKFECGSGDLAVFPNGTVMTSWSLEMTCDTTDFIWRLRELDFTQEHLVNIEKDIPVCVPNSNSGTMIGPSMSEVSFGLMLYILMLVNAFMLF